MIKLITRLGVRVAALFALTLLVSLCACNVTLTTFSLPAAVYPGDVFDIGVTGAGSAFPPTVADIGVVLQLPAGFSVYSAVASNRSPAVTQPTLASTYVAEPGHSIYAVSFASTATAQGACRLRVRSALARGTYVLKLALAVRTNGSGPWVPNVPAGLTQFAAVTTPNVVRSIVVTTDPASAPEWRIMSAGLPVSGMTVPNTVAFPTPTRVEVADLDGDGRKDLGVGSLTDAGETNYSRGRLIEGFLSAGAPPNFDACYLGMASGHFNGDALRDTVVGRYVNLATAPGVFAQSAILIGPFVTPATVQSYPPYESRYAVADFNGDGFDDIAGLFDQLALFFTLEVHLSTGTGSFVDVTPANPGFTSVLGDPQVGDVDSDGDLDLFATSDVMLVVAANDGAGNFTHLTDPSLFVNGVNSAALGDFNDDGIPDFVVSFDSGGTPSTTIWYGAGNGVWTPAAAPLVNQPMGCMRTGDLDGDGIEEVVMMTRKPQTTLPPVDYAEIQIWRKTPGVGLARDTALESGFTADSHLEFGGLQLADVDDDGLLDIVVADVGGLTVYLRNGARNESFRGNVAESLPFGPVPVLTVNGLAADPATRTVPVAIGQPIIVAVTQSPTLVAPSRFVLWGWIGLPDEVTAMPSAIGTFAFMPHMVSPGAPGLFTIADSFQPTSPLAFFMGASPGPYLRTIANGLIHPYVVSLGGVIEDASEPVHGLARMNTVIVDVH